MATGKIQDHLRVMKLLCHSTMHLDNVSGMQEDIWGHGLYSDLLITLVSFTSPQSIRRPLFWMH